MPRLTICPYPSKSAARVLWSTKFGHGAKAVKRHNEVTYDNRNKREPRLLDWDENERLAGAGITGRGKQKVPLRRFAHELGFAERVRLLGLLRRGGTFGSLLIFGQDLRPARELAGQ